MSQQAQNDYYRDEESMALAYAEAVHEEIHELFAAGADVVQLDEPWMQARPEKARQYAVKAINRALEGVQGTTVHHLLGYAASVKQKPSAYSFLPELEHAAVQQVSIEAAQPQLDLSILKTLPSKSIMLGVLNLNDMTPETPEIVAQRIRAALPYVPPERLLLAPDCGMKFLLEISPTENCVLWSLVPRSYAKSYDLDGLEMLRGYEGDDCMSYETILYETQERIAYITLNRPRVLNAYNDTMGDELLQAHRAFDQDDDLHVLIISGGTRLLLWGRRQATSAPPCG